MIQIYKPEENQSAPPRKVTLLTIPQAAELVDGLTKFRIRQMCIDGELPYIQAGKKYLINADVLLQKVSCNI